MKTKALFGIVGVALSWSSSTALADDAAMDHAGMAGHSLSESPAPVDATNGGYMAEGEVRKIDAAQGKITLKHGPLAHLGMETGMTMIFRVQDKSIMESLKTGDKVHFRAERVNGSLTVTSIEKSE